MKNGKYVLNYQHVCYDASGCASPICLAHIHPCRSIFIRGGKKGKHKVEQQHKKKKKLFNKTRPKQKRSTKGICAHPAVLVEVTLIQTDAQENSLFFKPIVQRLEKLHSLNPHISQYRQNKMR